jgi:hypothetical protein
VLKTIVGKEDKSLLEEMDLFRVCPMVAILVALERKNLEVLSLVLNFPRISEPFISKYFH